MPAEVCACGAPLHYSDPEIQRYVQAQIDALGETVTIHVLGADAWKVPRHFVALHGVKAAELPELGPRLGFERVEA